MASPLFDTRISSFPNAPIGPVVVSDTSTTLDGFPLVFEDQYLQVTFIVYVTSIVELIFVPVEFSSST